MNVLIFPKEALKYFFITLSFRLNLNLHFSLNVTIKGDPLSGHAFRQEFGLVTASKGLNFATKKT